MQKHHQESLGLSGDEMNEILLAVKTGDAETCDSFRPKIEHHAGLNYRCPVCIADMNGQVCVLPVVPIGINIFQSIVQTIFQTMFQCEVFAIDYTDYTDSPPPVCIADMNWPASGRDVRRRALPPRMAGP